MLQLLEFSRRLIVMHDRRADKDGVGPGTQHGVHLPSRLDPAHRDDGSILHPLRENPRCRPQVDCHRRKVAVVNPQDIGRRLDRRIPLLKRGELQDDSELSIMRLIDEHLHPAMEVPPAREVAMSNKADAPHNAAASTWRESTTMSFMRT